MHARAVHETRCDRGTRGCARVRVGTCTPGRRRDDCLGSDVDEVSAGGRVGGPPGAVGPEDNA
eukprot:5773720-Pleurochrysis_carterae.AAC.1